MRNMDIFNELSEHVTLRIHSSLEVDHDSYWAESKVHSDYDIWLVLSGHIHIETGGSSFQAAKGDLIFFYPHTLYTARTKVDGCRFLYIHFDFGLGGNFRILNEFNLAGIITGESIGEEAAIFKKAYELYRENAGMSGIRLKGGLFVLLARILEMYGNEQYTGHFLREKTQFMHARGMIELQPVFGYIAEQLSRPIRIRELAVLAGMSEKYFITHFKNTLGITPGQYMYQLRMNRAREHLYRKNYSIKEISALLGYTDPYTFSKAFKKYYNVAPSHFV